MELRGRFYLVLGTIAVLLSTPLFAAQPTTAAQDASDAEVEVVRVPEGGYQVQAEVASDGTLHTIYLRGEPGHADIFYSRRNAKGEWSSALRVNSVAESAVGIGTIRGPQLAVGPEGRVHVVWFGSEKAGVKAPAGGAPLLYTRLNDAGTAFEPQRSLMQRSTMLDGGPSLAADARGVYVAWHGAEASAPNAGEPKRRLWVTRSTDAGRTFPPETAVNSDPTGACACCSVKVFAEKNGRILVLYRAATPLPGSTSATERDICLIASTDGGQRFTGARLDPWRINACPMSSESMAAGPEGMLSAWETEGRIRWGIVDPKRPAVASIWAVPGSGATRRHPSVAVNRRGDVLLAWTEGTGWARGGDLAWQLFDHTGKPRGAQVRIRGGVPVWGLVAAAARPDGSFTLLH